MRTVTVRITSFAGTWFGGSHSYASITVRDERGVELQFVQVEYELTTSQARALNEADPVAPPLEAGDLTGRFFSRADAKDAVRAWLDEHGQPDDQIIGSSID